MAEPQPPALVEGATTGDVEDEIADVPKAAEDRKAAAALSSLDAREDEAGATKNVDQDAVKAAMSRLGGGAEKAANTEAPKEVKKAIKVNPADVALLVDQLEVSKVKATEMLKAHEGDAVQTLRAYVTSSA